MFTRRLLLVLLLTGFSGLTLAQEPGAIPEPNEVLEQQPPPPMPEAVLVAPATPPAADARFGGDDGVFRFVVVGDGLATGLGAGLERLTDLDPRFEPGTPEWSNAYKANMDAILASITGNGARVYWVTLPPMQSEEFETQMKMVSSLQRERIVTGGHALLDVRPALVTPEGAFMLGDLDANGKARRLRAKDGIKFSRQGNDYLAALVMGALRRAERVPELQSAKDDPSPLDVQVAVAVPQTTSPLFGQQGVDGADVSYEADALAKEVPQKITPDLSNAGKLGLKIARNSLAQRFYRTGEALGVPYGRFDDFSVSGAAP